MTEPPILIKDSVRKRWGVFYGDEVKTGGWYKRGWYARWIWRRMIKRHERRGDDNSNL